MLALDRLSGTDGDTQKNGLNEMSKPHTLACSCMRLDFPN